MSNMIAHLLCLLAIAGEHLVQSLAHSPCRFAPLYTQDEVLADPAPFAWDVFYWEGRFHQNSVGYNTENGMSYDGTLLDPTTGIANFSGLHQFSAASKEVRLGPIMSHRWRSHSD